MKHERASEIRADIRMILKPDKSKESQTTDDPPPEILHALHVRYMQEDKMELIVPRNQAQPITQRLIKVGHSMVRNCSLLGMQVRRKESSEDKWELHNAYCARRALKRALSRGIFGRSWTLFYGKRLRRWRLSFPLYSLTRD